MTALKSWLQTEPGTEVRGHAVDAAAAPSPRDSARRAPRRRQRERTALRRLGRLSRDAARGARLHRATRDLAGRVLVRRRAPRLHRLDRAAKLRRNGARARALDPYGRDVRTFPVREQPRRGHRAERVLRLGLVTTSADTSTTTYTCVVNAIRPPGGDGPTFLRVRNDFGTWRLDYEYPDGAVQTLTL